MRLRGHKSKLLRYFRFLLRPNKAQASSLERILEDSCETYNAAIQERKEAWKLERKCVSYYDQQGQLTKLRKDPNFSTISIDIQRDPLRRVDRAFKGFFRRCKAGKNPGYPRFKPISRYDSFAFHLPIVRKRSIMIPRLGDIRARGGRDVTGKPKFCAIKREGKRWFANVVCDIGAAPEKVVVSRAVGIDLGLTNFVTLSNGQAVKNPRWERRHEARIKAARRALARKEERSKNRLKALEVLRRAHQRAVDARKNFCHHLSKLLVHSYDLIAFEKLNIEEMARGRFSKSVRDAAWGLLIWYITYKAEYAGKWAVPVNPKGTSQICSDCGEPVPKKIWDRRHICRNCGLYLDRDHNAARNVLKLGCGMRLAESNDLAELLLEVSHAGL